MFPLNADTPKRTYTLFCFPFAGGNSYSFRDLGTRLPNNVKPIPIELPGRGKRIREALLIDIKEIVEDTFLTIKHSLKAPYALYGHSMGAVISYLIIRKVIDEKLPLPVHLFVSGRGGPSCIREKKKIYSLPSKEFEKKIEEMGGMTKEILENKELMVFFEPILKADFEAVENYEYIKSVPFPVRITVMVGAKEDVTDQEAKLWQMESTMPIEVLKFEGGHFFIFDHIKEIADTISMRLH